MRKSKAPTASLRGSPNCIHSSKEDSGESQIAPFPTSGAEEVCRSGEELRVRADLQTLYIRREILQSEILTLEARLSQIIRPPKSGNDGDMPLRTAQRHFQPEPKKQT